MKNKPTSRIENSSDQHFLLARAEHGTGKKPATAPAGELLFALGEHFPQLAAGSDFVDEAMSRMEGIARFSAVIVQIDVFETSESTSIRDVPDPVRLKVAQAIDAASKPCEGIWGPLDRISIACFFPDQAASDAVKTAEKIRSAVASNTPETVSMGIAVFPTLDYPKDRILDNAWKALDHASFFGPGSLCCFDSVSLNISGDRFYDQGDVKSAVAEFETALKLDPSNANVHNSLGVCHGIMGKLDAALEAFRKASALDPRDVLSLFNTGLAYHLKDEKEAALEYLLKAEANPHSFSEVRLQIGRVYLEMGLPEEARPYLEKAVKMQADSGPGHSSLAECYAALQLEDKAVKAYKRALRLNANDASALSGLGWLYHAQGRNLEIAALFCKHSVEIAPQNGLFRNRLGQLYLQENRYDEARIQFEKASKLGFDSSEQFLKLKLLAGEKSA